MIRINPWRIGIPVSSSSASSLKQFKAHLFDKNKSFPLTRLSCSRFNRINDRDWLRYNDSSHSSDVNIILKRIHNGKQFLPIRPDLYNLGFKIQQTFFKPFCVLKKLSLLPLALIYRIRFRRSRSDEL